jgi:GMP synthase-like glutamine amidotransferase
MQVQVIRHHAEDSAGLIGAGFQARGARLRTHLYPDEGPLPELDGIDHVVLLGATSSVYDARDWIGPELDWLLRADQAGVPVLGICFGAQALCGAHGGTVRAAGGEEIGWRLVETLDPELIPAGPWLQYHGDHCLPPGHARLLARNEFGVQAFSVGRHLGVQFHPEVDGVQLAAWLDAGARDELLQAGHDPEAFLAETIAAEPAASVRAAQIVEAALRIAAAPLSAAQSPPPPLP